MLSEADAIALLRRNGIIMLDVREVRNQIWRAIKKDHGFTSKGQTNKLDGRLMRREVRRAGQTTWYTIELL